jgi:hypothetical protein
MAIRRSDRVRLAELAGPRIWPRRIEVERRVRLREHLSFCVLVGALLAIEDVDVETTCIARELRDAQAELDAIPDTDELEEADEAYLARTSWVDDWQPRPRYRPPLVDEPIERDIERRMKRYRTDLKDRDLAKMSVIDLYAWCLSKHGETYAEAAAAAQKAAANLLLRLDELPDEPTDEDIERALLAEENQ